jgi:NTE family protein
MNRKNCSTFLLTFIILIIFGELDARPKIGLTLSGGGARGFAHIGALKMIDSLQIPVDYIAGTSMGGIIGALYASGYSAEKIEQMAYEANWEELFTDRPPRSSIPYLQKKDDGKFQIELGLDGFTPVIPSGLVGGQKIALLFANLTASTPHTLHFDSLSIPYRCITVDLLSGREVVLKRGSLAKAMRATMAIPTVFSPVEWGDSLLVDGYAAVGNR